MAIVNFKKECNIPTFSRARKGWAKRITGLDKSKANGYSFQGDFVSLGNFDTNLLNGVYLDCSKKANNEGEVEKTYHIFSVEDGEITLLQTVEDGKGWAVKCWDSIDDYLNREGITSNELLNQILEKTSDESVLIGLVEEIKDYVGEECSDLSPFYNEYHQKGIMEAMGYGEFKEYTYRKLCEKTGKKSVYETLKEKGLELNLKMEDKGKNEFYDKDICNIINAFGWIYEDDIPIEDVWTGKIPIYVREINADLLANRSYIFNKQENTHRNCNDVCFYFDQKRHTISHNRKHTFMVSYDYKQNVILVEHFYHYRDDSW